MTGEQLNKGLNLGAQSARYRETGDWYHPLTTFPAVLFDLNGYVIFQTVQDYLQSPILRGQDIHIKNGISSFNNYQRYSTQQLIIVKTLSQDYESALRIKREYSTYHRNQANVQAVKAAFNNKCAICETTIKINNDQFYSEAHHIFPLNENGPDTIDNMICVCPNCHVKLDLKIMRIDLTRIYNPNNHQINKQYSDRHNNNVA